jgi:hypothetical protein
MVTLIVLCILGGGLYAVGKAAKKAAANANVVTGVGSMLWSFFRK